MYYTAVVTVQAKLSYIIILIKYVSMFVHNTYDTEIKSTCIFHKA